MDYLQKELEEYNKLRKAFDKDARRGMADDLANQMMKNRGDDNNTKNRDQNAYNYGLTSGLEGDGVQSEMDRKRKTEDAKAMRDYYAYKMLQKDLDKERALKDKDDYNRMLDDDGRK